MSRRFDENFNYFSGIYWHLFTYAALYPAQTRHFNLNARFLPGGGEKRNQKETTR
jgi:hypothetical protein